MPPSDQSSPGTSRQIRVIAAVIRRDGRVLLAQRPLHKRHGGLWEFPGGKMEPGETLLDAARRELAEELSLTVTGTGPVLFSRRDPGSPFVIDFVEIQAHGEPRPHEHLSVRWVEVTSLRELPLAPSDADFAVQLGSMGGGQAPGEDSSQGD